MIYIKTTCLVIQKAIGVDLLALINFKTKLNLPSRLLPHISATPIFGDIQQYSPDYIWVIIYHRPSNVYIYYKTTSQNLIRDLWGTNVRAKRQKGWPWSFNTVLFQGLVFFLTVSNCHLWISKFNTCLEAWQRIVRAKIKRDKILVGYRLQLF